MGTRSNQEQCELSFFGGRWKQVGYVALQSGTEDLQRFQRHILFGHLNAVDGSC